MTSNKLMQALGQPDDKVVEIAKKHPDHVALATLAASLIGIPSEERAKKKQAADTISQVLGLGGINDNTTPDELMQAFHLHEDKEVPMGEPIGIVGGGPPSAASTIRRCASLYSPKN